RLHVVEHPKESLEVVSDGVVQGWLLSGDDGKGLRLALAMRHRDATVSGVSIYDAAFAHYARAGHSRGHASFSVANRPTLNLYAELGARFTSTLGCWFQVR